MFPLVMVAIALAGPATAFAEKYEDLKKEADQLFEEGEYAKAEKIYLTLVEEYDKVHEPEVYFNLGICFEKQEKWDHALSAYTPFFIEPYKKDVELASTVQFRCIRIQLDKMENKERAHSMLSRMLEEMHKDYRNNPEYPKTNAVLEEAVTLYKELETELKLEPNIEAEKEWGLRELVITTEEQKAFILDAQGKSEVAPLVEENKRNSVLAFKLLEESDNIYVVVVGTPIIKSFGEDTYKYNDDLFIHYILSLGVYAIKNPVDPDAADPPDAVEDLKRNYFALERTAVKYLKIRKETGLKHPEMEELLKIGKDGVKAYLEEHLRKEMEALNKSLNDSFNDLFNNPDARFKP